jgi:hypothetical protein
MRVPVPLSEAFGQPFEALLRDFATEEGLLPPDADLHSPRFLSRSIVPHVERLSGAFNRVDSGDQGAGLSRRYWKEGSNPANLKLAYLLYFMPSNLYRVAAVWAELARLGFRWRGGDTLRAIEPGAGPASGASGIAAGERFAPTGLPRQGNWALIEQDRSMLETGSRWAERYFTQGGEALDWGTRPFHRKLDFSRDLLPRSAPRFNLWVMSYFLNEVEAPAGEMARRLLDAWERHLGDEGVVILVEPALKLQSRKLLELRRALIERMPRMKGTPMQVLLPCLGHQACGALAAAEDWCHEEVSWWRPPSFRRIDEMASLDRKTLPFSYLVLTRSARPIEEILPALKATTRHRLVSPAHFEGKDLEFFVCGSEGKRRARYRPEGEELYAPPSEEPVSLAPVPEGAEVEGLEELERESAGPVFRKKRKALDRGDILLDAELHGDAAATRVERFRKPPSA